MTEIQLQLALANTGFVAPKPGIDRKGSRDSNTAFRAHFVFSNSCFSFLYMLASFYFSSNVLFPMTWMRVSECVCCLGRGGHRWLLTDLYFSCSLVTWKKNEVLLFLPYYLTILGKSQIHSAWLRLVLNTIIVCLGQMPFSKSTESGGSSFLRGIALLLSA